MRRSKAGPAFFLLLVSLAPAAPVRAAALPLTAGQELPAAVLPGPVRLTVRLPDDRSRALPLLAIGGPDRGSLLFWIWDGAGQARIGFEDAGHGVSFSAPFAAMPGDAHVLDVAWGALWLAAKPEAELSSALRGLLWVAVDGRVLLSRQQAFALRTPHVFFGANRIGSGLCRPSLVGGSATVEAGEALRPELDGVRLASLLSHPHLLPGGYPGPLRLRFSLPRGIAGQTEPLLVGGKLGVAGFLYVHFEDERHFRLGFSAWGWGGPVSEPIAFEPETEGELRFSAGLLYPPPAVPPQAGDPAEALLPAVLWAEWNGRVVLATVTPCPTVRPDQITLGANLVGGNVSTPGFRGLFTEVGQLDPAAVADAVVSSVFPRVAEPGPGWQGFPGPVRLRVVFPKVWPVGRGEPLVVAGPVGAADMVYVTYDEEGHMHLGMDHWGGAYLSSVPISVAPGSEHELTIAMGALMPPADAPLYAQRPDLAALRQVVRVDFDGRPVVTGVRQPFATRPGQITYGINLAGGSTSGPCFTGRILRMEGVPGGMMPPAR